MKWQLFFSFIIAIGLKAAFYNMPFSRTMNQICIFSGRVLVPDKIEIAQPLHIFYKGAYYEIPPSGAIHERNSVQFEFYEKEAVDSLYLLVTENLEQPQDNTINHFTTCPSAPYRFFKLERCSFNITATSQPKAKIEKMHSWRITELDSSLKKREIPDNTVIFFMNPAFVELLDSQSWAADSAVIKLPQIVLKKNIKQEDFDQILVKIALTMPDFNPFHGKPSIVQRFHQQGNIMLSMPRVPQVNC